MSLLSERTCIIVKPDGVNRGAIGKIINRFERKGFKLIAMKFLWATETQLKEHYASVSHQPFFPKVLKYMTSGPIVAMVWEGLNIVEICRKLLGHTDPAKSPPGTIRGDFCLQIGHNIAHGSDSVDDAKKESNLWFTPDQLVSWTSLSSPLVYENQQ